MMSLKVLWIGLVLALLSPMPVMAETVHADARAQPAAPVSSQLHMGASQAPDGSTIGINNRYLTRNGQPWLPVMGEFHYARVPADEWDVEIRKMKASGVDIISTYVVWQYHEEKPGVFDFSGDRDLRRFLQLCARNDMKVVLRLGPWAHGEVRYGGLPDWLVAQTPTRQNDPVYMGFVERYWQHVYDQAKGLLFKDGGPVIAIQLENEYNQGGPGRGADHIAALKDMARRIGFDVPLYTVTGWNNAIYPSGEVVPVFGGYPDAPWGTGQTQSPPSEVYSFRFSSRVAGETGAQTVATGKGTAMTDMQTTPFLGAEYAGGLPIMYRRRTLVTADDIAAMVPVQLGSGVNLYGYYMYHGGRNPAGDTTFEENALIGGFNDVPIINYDFQAPFGEYGQAHPVLAAIRPFNLFLNSFGDRLAPMAVHAPSELPQGKDDLNTLRWDVRSLGDSGFIFVGNYLRQYAMAAHTDVRFDIDLPDGRLQFPYRPVKVADGDYFIWPFRFDLDGIRLDWATAQPLTRIVDGAGHATYVFAASDGIAPEFAFDEGVALKTASGHVSHHDGRLIVSAIRPGRGEALRLRANGHDVSVIVLSAADAQSASVVDFAGRRRLVLTPATVFVGDHGDLTLRSEGKSDFDVQVFPALAGKPAASLPLTSGTSGGTSGLFQTWRAQAKAVSLTASVQPLRPAGKAPPVMIGGRAHAALQPYPEQFGVAAAWQISVPPHALDGLSNLYMHIRYRGDIGRLFGKGALLDDDFWSGPDWVVGLKRFPDLLKAPLTLTVMPLRADAPIYIDARYAPDFKGQPQLAELKGVDLVPEYQLVLTPPTR
ncbi:beta-galactosidase [Asticcacaulis sp. EMRT-3]|uniref:beta-galactosidase n=1 Tax=Asticcacaulis sp. EMRT-3 TaxID=3040349 RepID=UPI0024AFC8E9|nr:beta-galactosidase [Asticcacaulis sp. EMRT-3]MDI7775093.1 beta-galactosidase [Asticcacaulis sp. EMRT-3]